MKAAVTAWNRFWFECCPLNSLGLFRIALALTWMLKIIFLVPILPDFFSPDGIFTLEMSQRWLPMRICLLDYLPPHSEPVVLGASLLFSVLLALGIQVRLATVGLFLSAISLETRSPLIFNSGDRLLILYLFFGIFTPWHKRYALQQRPAIPAPRNASESPGGGWAFRMIQLQICFLYFWSAYYKLAQPAWKSGQAVYWVSQNIERVWSGAIADWAGYDHLGAILTRGTLVFEALFPILIWFPPFRISVLLLGLLFHLGIQATLNIQIFEFALLSGYLLFLKDEEARALAVNIAKFFDFRHNRV